MSEVKYKYKNTSGIPQTLAGYGEVQENATIETKEVINNPNFELVFDGDDKVGIESSPKKPKNK